MSFKIKILLVVLLGFWNIQNSSSATSCDSKQGEIEISTFSQPENTLGESIQWLKKHKKRATETEDPPQKTGAILALLLGLLGTLVSLLGVGSSFGLFFLGILLAISGIVVGVVVLNRAKKGGISKSKKRLATIGIVISSIATVSLLVFLKVLSGLCC